MNTFEITFTELVERTGQMTVQAETEDQAIEKARVCADTGTIIDVGEKPSHRRLRRIEGPGIEREIDVPSIPAAPEGDDEAILSQLAPALLGLAVNVLRAADAAEEGDVLASARARGVRRDAARLVAAATNRRPIERTVEVHAA